MRPLKTSSFDGVRSRALDRDDSWACRNLLPAGQKGPTGMCEVKSPCAQLSEVITFGSARWAKPMVEVEVSSSTSAEAAEEIKRKGSKKHMHGTPSLHVSPIHSPKQTFSLYRSLSPSHFSKRISSGFRPVDNTNRRNRGYYNKQRAGAPDVPATEPKRTQNWRLLCCLAVLVGPTAAAAL